jgi:outer membrane protein OmpA-like peptidoglycan-associated protein
VQNSIILFLEQLKRVLMNHLITSLLGRPRAAIATTALTLFGVCTSLVFAQEQRAPQSKPIQIATSQAAPETAPPSSDYAELENAGSVTEPQGEDYVVPKKLNPKLARVTLYRPAQGFTPGVAHLEVNGHYHTSLQLGGYTEICVEPADFQLAAHMVQTGEELNNFQDATTTLKLQATQNLYVRVFEYGDGRATLTPVKGDIALAELQNTRRQIHAATRVAEAKACVEPDPRTVGASAKPDRIVKESIVLGSDALFGFGKSDIKGISVTGRAALDDLIAHLQKQYGSDDSILLHITGHADPLGNSASNKRLSEARAMAIRAYMLEAGISAKRITGEGVGSEQPVITTCGKTANPETIECNKPNRRVVVSVQVLAR